MLALAFLVLPTSALGAKTVVNTLGSTTAGVSGGLFNQPRGLAVNKSGDGGVPAGTFYVADALNARVQRISPTSEFVAAWGWGVATGAAQYEICAVAANCLKGLSGSGAGQFGPVAGAQGVAVDQSNGIVYVADQNQHRIDAFSATGNFEGALGWGVVGGDTAPFSLDFCTSVTGCQVGQSGAEAGELAAAIGGMAVNGAHELLVADKTNRRVDVYSPTFNLSGEIVGASFARAFGWGVKAGDVAPFAFDVCTTISGCQAGQSGAELGEFGTNSPTDVALDSSGNLYALDAPNKRVEKFDLSIPASPSPVASPAFDASAAITTAFGATPGNLYGIAVDTATDRLYLSGSNSASSPVNQVRVEEMTSAGVGVETHGPDLTITTAVGLAVAPQALGGNIYLSSLNGGQRVFVLNSPPLVSLDDVTNETGTTASLAGSVDPAGSSVVCKFQYSADGVTWTDVPGDPCAALDPSGGIQPVSSEATGLDEGTAYHVRLVASKPFGAGTASAEETFTTLGRPLISNTAASNVQAATAVLGAQVNPQRQATTYHFEYVDDTAFDEGGFVGATQVPVPEASAGEGGEPIPIFRPIGELSPDTTYHFRLVATNPTGSREGEEETFTTYAAAPSFEAGSCATNESTRTDLSARLPDCRAYEQVSPRDKNGSDVIGDPNEVQASPSGDAVTFEVSGGIPGGEGAQNIPTYLAGRDSGSWSSSGVLPPASYGSSSLPSGWTSDLSRFFSSTSKKGGEPAFLMRGADGTVTEISPYTSNGGGTLDDASADGSMIFFENEGAVLDAGGRAAPGKDNLYVWNRETGQVDLVGVLPDSACASPPCVPRGGSFAGAYTWFAGTNATTLAHGGAITNDGRSQSSEYIQDQHAISTSGDRAYFTAGATGQLYLRKGLTSQDPMTVQVNESERSVPDPAGTQTAAFMSAAADGSKALFTSPQKLTDDAGTGLDHPGPTIARANIDGSGKNLGFLSVPGDAGVAVDAGHIYWADPDHGTIGRANLDGSSPDPAFIVVPEIEVKVGEKVPARPEYVAVDGSHLYWSNATDGGKGTGTIGRADLNGQNLNVSCITGATEPLGIAIGKGVDANHIYWSNTGEPGGRVEQIGRADIGTDCAAATAGADQEFIEPPSGATPQGITADEEHIYYTTSSSGGNADVRRVGLDGSNEVFLILGSSPDIDPQGISVDGTSVYWAQRKTGTIGRADLDLTNPQADFITEAGSVKGVAVDASHLYWSANGEAKPNPGNDLYRYDDSAGAGENLTDLTPDSNFATDFCPGGEEVPCGAQVKGVVATSALVDYAYFVANGVLAGNEGANGEHAELGDCEGGAGVNFNDISGECSLYLWNDDGSANGEVTFVARLDAHSDAADWEQFSGQAVGRQRTARVSADGRTLLFRSKRQLTSYDNEGVNEFYRYRVPGPGVICVTCNPTGAAPTGEPGLQSIRAFQLHVESGISLLTRNLSANGNRVFFETTEKLVGADTNGDSGCPAVLLGGGAGYPSCLDVYEWEASGAGSCHGSAQNGGCLYLLSPGTGGASFFGDADEEGENAFIFSRDQLVPADGDQLQDAYDARVGGGLAAQQQRAPTSCSGDGCRGPASSLPPAGTGAGSQSFSGPGNQQGKRHRHKKHHHKRRHRRAKNNRGAHR